MPLTRRDFAGIASCAICAVTGFIATDASAQGTPPAATPGVTRKILSQTDGPTPGYVTIIAEAEIEAGVTVTALPASLPLMYVAPTAFGSCQRDVPRSRFLLSGSVEAVGRHRT